MNRMFKFLWIGLIMLLTPYFYCAHLINTYGQQNAPAGFDFPKYNDLILTVILVALIGVFQKGLLNLSRIFFDKIVKGQDEPELK